MDAAQYTASLDHEQLHYEARHLAHALWLTLELGHREPGILDEERCAAGAHLAWRLVQHTRRLCEGFEEQAKLDSPSSMG